MQAAGIFTFPAHLICLVHLLQLKCSPWMNGCVINIICEDFGLAVIVVRMHDCSGALLGYATFCRGLSHTCN